MISTLMRRSFRPFIFASLISIFATSIALAQNIDFDESLLKENPGTLVKTLRSPETNIHKVFAIAMAFTDIAHETQKSGKPNPDLDLAFEDLSTHALNMKLEPAERFNNFLPITFMAPYYRKAGLTILKIYITENIPFIRKGGREGIRSLKRLQDEEVAFVLEQLHSNNKNAVIRALEIARISAPFGLDERLWKELVVQAHSNDSENRATALVALALVLHSNDPEVQKTVRAQDHLTDISEIGKLKSSDSATVFTLDLLQAILDQNQAQYDMAVKVALKSPDVTTRRLAMNRSPFAWVSQKSDERGYLKEGEWPNIEWIKNFSPLLSDSNEEIRTTALEFWEDVRLVTSEHSDWRNAMDAAMADGAASRKSKLSSKAALQTLAQHHADWIKASYPDQVFDENKTAWNYAMRSLSLLFVTQASTTNSEVQPIVDKMKLGFLKNDAGVCSPGSLDKLHQEADAIFSRGVELPTIGQLWGTIFHLSLLRSLEKREPDQKFKDQLVTRKNEEEKKLTQMLANEPKFRSGRTGSLFHMFAVSSAILAMEHPPMSTIEQMNKISEAARSPLELPYDFGQESSGTRESAARNIPFYLALYLKDPDVSKKDQHREHLFQALQNYIDNMDALMAHVSRNLTHVGAGLAPYYFYSSIPYATAAVKLLLKDEKDVEKRKQLETIKTTLEEKLLSLVQEDGLFTPQGSQDYPNSSAYVNPLAGMALINLADDDPENFGVLIP